MSFDAAEERDRVLHMAAYSGHVADYLSGLSYEQFAATTLALDAVECCVLRIDRAAAGIVPARLEAKVQPATWIRIHGLADYLRHRTRPGDPKRIWEVARNDLPVLREQCAAALAERE
ncbi:MAG TPA: HepT-like ribonuclease domain-containing protein [Allosphingosinicella sp.]